MIPPEMEEWHGVWIPGFFLIFVFIYFNQLNDELDEHNEFKYNSPDKIILFSLDSYSQLKITGKNQSS